MNKKQQTTRIRKLLLFLSLLFTGLGTISAQADSNTRITLKLSHAKLISALEEIKKQSGFSFIYNEKIVQDVTDITVDVKEVSIDSAMTAVLKGTGLSFRIQGNIIMLEKRPTTAPQQSARTITGTVKDERGEPLPGVSVLIKGSINGVSTDVDGKFQLTVPAGNNTLIFSFVGMKTQEIQLKEQTHLNIQMQLSMDQLDEVVVTGYGGSQKRAALTTAISKMDDQVLKNAAISNAGQALQGSVTGLRVINTTGQPGAEPDITLRGGATITGGNSKALIVVDGIIRESMSDINPSDIESIQVLKDAASTAIYGARANGGVILVETKSGKAGKASVNYKFKLGVNFARYGYDFVNAHDYIYYNRLGYKRYTNNVPGAGSVDTQTGYGTQNDLIDLKYLTDENAHLRNEGWMVMDDPYYEGQQLLYKDYSGQLDDAVFANTALTQDHYVNITGGNDKGTYMASMGYYNEDGQIKGTGYKRFNGSVSGTYKIFPFLNVKA